ncbi:acetyl-CoA synthetase-like protein [Conidiobolus coronatus NRRL 28638]|uniref:Acetyl-CoA synthetase-like protein n=1 Tax=Conidiobolus coronatus (strain ATCC 28846 / CBS 209.66 / NRRL 28638) TaxID=796925 RepID=A0A137NS83_CONC2|nr:acetyl-CoA synthetase-like protein [Conidiobolus coronatus NRRL 28638]|eukprot:KXN65615.1 acetyl-CoA synthetase-like protein [Conidiobolus coronatus NRRL 28638]
MASVHYSSTGRYVDLVQDNVILGKRVSYPAISINPYGKYIDINFEEFYYVVSHSANYFYSKLKSINFSSGKNIGLLSHSDSHYLWNMLGLMAVNVTPVLLSPRNSLEATVHLIKNLILNDMAIAIKKQIPSLILIPKWIAKFPDSLTPAKYTPLIPVESKQKELDNITYIIHSSGSTSFPKLISQTNRICFNSGHRFKLEETPLDRKEINFFPLFHTGGVLGTIIMYTYQLKSMTICPDLAPGSHFSSKMILDLVQNLSPELMGILPLMLKELIEYCNNVEYSQGWGILKKLEIMRYGGAQMPKQLVQFLIDNGITPVSAFASTECGMLMKSVSEWHGKGLPPSELTPGLQYTLKDWGDNVVELVISKDDPCLAYEFDRDEDGNYPTKDLFEIISNEPLLLQYFSRADDTIIHINGEKTNPIPMEDKLNSCPYIDRCAILGTGQQLNTLLVQLDTNELFLSPLHEVISTIKSYVKAVNESAPSHSRIYEEMIYYLPIISEKKLPVTIKGNLQRKKCAMMFKDEVKQSVEKMESGYVSRESPELEIISCDNEENIQHIVKECLRSCIDKQLGNNDSFFNNGMDSLSGMRFRNLLKSKIPDLEIKVTDIYDNDTAEKLIKFIKSSNLGKMLNTKSLEIYQKEVDDYITKYTFLGLEKPHSKKLPTENFHIAITGANGSLGSFMIKNLVEQDNVSKVYAFIRAKDHVQATEKLEHSFSKRFIDLCPEHSYKIVPIAINLHEDQLGLTQEAYAAITTKLTHIYHVGWTMNFLKGLDYFDDCIAASKNLMKLCVLSQRKVIYNFVSTIGATFPTASPVNTSVPELKLNTKLVNTAACNGYNLSKLVTETVCQIWSKDYDIPLHIYRVGQISGDTINGAWNSSEHFPLLVKGIQVMKLCPDILESSVAWIPVDVAADAIAEIGTQNQTVENTFMHIVNPKEYSWKVIYNALKSHGIEFGVVSVQEFIRQLKTNPEFQNADANPLATLTDFFDTIFLSGHVATLETKFTKKSSLAMAKCPALDSELMMKYLKFWNEQKFIQ